MNKSEGVDGKVCGGWKPTYFDGNSPELVCLYGMSTIGNLNSEGIYEVMVSPKMQTKNYKDRSKKNSLNSPKIT